MCDGMAERSGMGDPAAATCVSRLMQDVDRPCMPAADDDNRIATVRLVLCTVQLLL
jgi:hypothetical protein